MAYGAVAEPVPVSEAFIREDDAALQSQAALLLTIGNLLRYRDPRFEEPPPPPLPPTGLTAEAEAAGEPAGEAPVLAEEDREELAIPPELFDLSAARGARFDAQFIRERSRPDRGLTAAAEPRSAEAAAQTREAAPRLAEQLQAEPADPVTAAALVEVNLTSPDELVRVSAAAAYVEIALEHQLEPAIAILVKGTESDDPLVREVAATGLAKVVPGHPALLRLMQPAGAIVEGEPAHTGLMVHGTFARQGRWWQPGGDFHTYIKTTRAVDPNLYAAPDRFEWSGGYSDAARALAAIELIAWMNDRGFGCLDVFAHSHGASVAMLASKTANFGRMVLLSCPVHRRKYFPNFARVQKVISIRVRADLVILADGGGQRFRDPRIQEIVLPIWFNHSVTHDPGTWDAQGLPGRVGAPIC